MKPQSFSAVSLISQLRIKMSHAGTGKEKGTLQGSPPLQHHMCNHIRIFISLALVVPLDSFLFLLLSRSLSIIRSAPNSLIHDSGTP